MARITGADSGTIACVVNSTGIKAPKIEYSTYQILADLINTSRGFSELARKHSCSRQNIYTIYLKALKFDLPVKPR